MWGDSLKTYEQTKKMMKQVESFPAFPGMGGAGEAVPKKGKKRKKREKNGQGKKLYGKISLSLLGLSQSSFGKG
jgi:hypothetical protein